MKYPDVDKEIYLALFKTLSEAAIDPDLGLSMLRDIKARKQASELSEAYFKFSNGNIDKEQLAAIVDGNAGLSGDGKEADEFEFVTDSLSEIISNIFQKPGLRWRLNALNKSLGSLRKGNFGFVFARPETGKTTFLASEMKNVIVESNTVMIAAFLVIFSSLSRKFFIVYIDMFDGLFFFTAVTFTHIPSLPLLCSFCLVEISSL